jgi:hypothetical protein
MSGSSGALTPLFLFGSILFVFTKLSYTEIL